MTAALPRASMCWSCASLHASILIESTLETWAPISRWTPAHLMQKSVPRLVDAHVGAPPSWQSAHVEFPAMRSSRASTGAPLSRSASPPPANALPRLEPPTRARRVGLRRALGAAVRRRRRRRRRPRLALVVAAEGEARRRRLHLRLRRRERGAVALAVERRRARGVRLGGEGLLLEAARDQLHPPLHQPDAVGLEVEAHLEPVVALLRVVRAHDEARLALVGRRLDAAQQLQPHAAALHRARVVLEPLQPGVVEHEEPPLPHAHPGHARARLLREPALELGHRVG